MFRDFHFFFFFKKRTTFKCLIGKRRRLEFLEYFNKRTGEEGVLEFLIKAGGLKQGLIIKLLVINL